MRYEIDLARDPDSAAEARRALGEVSDHLSPRRLEDARLLVSELVTNAIRHAGLGADDLIRLVVVTGDHGLRIEVCDPGTGFEPHEPEPDPAQPSGWGSTWCASCRTAGAWSATTRRASGSSSIASSGAGTTARARLPLLPSETARAGRSMRAPR